MYVPSDPHLFGLPERALDQTARLALGLQIHHPTPLVPVDGQNHLASRSLGSAREQDGRREDQPAAADLGDVERSALHQQPNPHVRGVPTWSVGECGILHVCIT